MTTNLVRSYKDNILAFQNNPTLVHAAGLALIRDSSEGLIEIVDCTNPFVALMETTAVTFSAALEKMAVYTRKQYAISAQTIEDLYPHMSDKDFSDRFATPSSTKFYIVMAMEELANALVLDPVTGTKRLTIPAHTNFVLADTTFSLQYPINIIQAQHGGYNVLYDVSNPSPLQSLETNVIAWEKRRDANRQEFMVFQVDVQQFNILTLQDAINSAQELKMRVAFNQQFYYARVYHGSSATGWKELITTHTDQIYDVTTPTAVLQVLESELVVRIPQIYVNAGLLTDKIRVDLYQTKGPLQLSLVDYPTDAAVTNFLTLDKSEDNSFMAPLRSMRQFQAFSPYTTSGGTDALSFEALRERVINNTMGLGDRVITNVELPTALQTKGYEVVANIDLLTNRAFLATRTMPVPSNPKLITAASASIETIATTVSKLLQFSGVKNNGKSITITPDVLYQNVGGFVSPVQDSVINSILNMVPEQRALAVTNGGFYYTPFHYVLDMSSSEFDLRAYYLDAPVITAKSYEPGNDTTLLQVATDAYVIARVPTGYKISISTNSSDAFKAIPDQDVYVQLAFTPYGEKDRAYMNGVLTNMTDGGERVYTFDLAVNHNVDANDNVEMLKFFMYDDEPRVTGAPLETKFDLLYAVGSQMGPLWKRNEVDGLLGTFMLPGQIAGVAHEVLSVKLGDDLDTLWARARTVAGSSGYKTWDVDIVTTYQDDVYERDGNGSYVSIVDGQVVTKKLHSKGEAVIIDGEPLIKYKKGEVMLDANLNPIPADSVGLERQMDLLLIEGAYWFATDAASSNYRNELTTTIVGWLTNDLESLSKKLLEQTRLYYYPKVNTGYIDVMTAEGLVLNLSASQSLRIDIVVTEQVYVNTELTAKMKTMAINQANAALNDQTVAADKIEHDLRDLFMSDAISVTVSGLGGDSNFPVLTVVDSANRLSLHKRLVAQTDDTLIVEEDVTVNFILHSKR